MNIWIPISLSLGTWIRRNGGGQVIFAGEVHTGLLQHSHSLSPNKTNDLLSLAAGETVRQSARPIAYAVSPHFLSGLDCGLPGAGREIRTVGTAMGRATITGGHILQGSTFAVIEAGTAKGRQPWSHYLASPGRLSTVSGRLPDDLATRLLGGPTAATAPQLDLGAISGRTMDLVHRNALLDRRPPFRAARTRFRWVATTTATPESADTLHLTIHRARLRTARVSIQDTSLVSVAQLCEDIAYHDWLLTTMLTIVERAGIGGRPQDETITALRPAVDHLLHLWMPGAHCDPVTRRLWSPLEDRPGFSRQWTTLVNRVRDQITIATLPVAERTVPAP